MKSLFGTDRDGNISTFLKKLYSQFYEGKLQSDHQHYHGYIFVEDDVSVKPLALVMK